MKRLIMATLIGCIVALSFSAQAQLYQAQNGEVSFFSKTPLENIDAVSKNVNSIINSATNEIAVQMRISSFVFPNKLMQEHFNENYLESEKYPMASFKGKIKEAVDLKKAGTYPVTASGTATIHGVTKAIEIKGTIISDGNQLQLTSQFDVQLQDYQIKIPKIVFAKIAEVIEVKSKILFSQKK
ncbi:YceI family protein [Aquirufa sp. Wall-65K1]